MASRHIHVMLNETRNTGTKIHMFVHSVSTMYLLVCLLRVISNSLRNILLIWILDEREGSVVA